MLPGATPLCGYATPEPEDLPVDAHAEMSSDSFRTWMDANLDPPACGPCLMLAGNLRFQATVLRHDARERIFPTRPQDAWKRIGETAWGEVLNVRASLPRMQKLKMGYAWGDFEVDHDQVASRATEHAARAQKIRQEYLQRHELEAQALCDRERPDYEDL